MKFSDIPNLPTERLIELAGNYERAAKQYATLHLKNECKRIARILRAEIESR